MSASEAEKSKAQLVIVTGLVVFSYIFESASTYLLYAAAIVGVLCIFIPIFYSNLERIKSVKHDKNFYESQMKKFFPHLKNKYEIIWWYKYNNSFISSARLQQIIYS